MRAVDAYLSRRAAAVWPGAVVTCYHDDRTDWRLDRPGELPIGLGHSFTEARRSLNVFARHVLAVRERRERAAG